MKLQDYKNALLEYFKVTSLKELRANKQWQELAAQKSLPDLRTRQSWELAYEAVFHADQQSVESDNLVHSSDKIPSNRILKTQNLESNSDETGTFHTLQNNQGQLVGGLLEYSHEQSQRLIDHFRNLQLHSPQLWHQGKLNSAVVDQFGAASTLVMSGLKAGQLFRVVGPPDLVGKIASGAYQMMQTSTGSLGTVTAAGGGKIVGQLRFAPGGAGLPILTPIIVYQVLHALVGTQQLNQINQRLAKIEHTLQELHVRQEAEVLGEIHYAINVLDDVLDSRMNTGIFSPDAISRLALAEKTILSILERNRLLVERFRDKTSSVKNQSGKKGARSAAELLKSDGPQAVYDMQCLVGLMAADLKLEQALLLLATQNNPTDVGRRQERIRAKMQSHHEVVKNLPSVQEIERHAEACLKAMQWWERMFDFGQTYRGVQSSKALDLKDIRLKPNALQSGLNGYVFWQDEEGVHAFSLSGEDLQLEAAKEQISEIKQSIDRAS